MLPINTPAEHMAGLLARRIVRAAERALDARVETLGTPLDAAARDAARDAGTLLIVSGYAGSVTGLGPFARSAARDGLHAVRHEIPRGGLASVDDAVRGLDELVRAQPEAAPLHLAGHSKGGAVVQEWWRTATPAQRARVASMTLVSSPPYGQHTPAALRPAQAAARTFGGPASTILHEVSSNSTLMRRIAAADVARHTRAMSIISDGDELVPVREAHWNDAANVVIGGSDAPRHIGTLGDARAYEALRANVLAGTP